MTRVVGIVQARMSSSRFPGKVLEQLSGRPLILFMLERLKTARTLDDLIVATSSDASDDLLVSTLADAGARYHRGSLDDVLDRFYGAASERGATHVVRLTGDCPLIDPDLVDRAVRRLLESGRDYVSNIEPATFPDGLSVEALSYRLLERMWREAELKSEREHVTLYARSRLDSIEHDNVFEVADLSHLRWTVDYEDDLEVVRLLCTGVADPILADRFDFLRVASAQPNLLMHNKHQRYEGLRTSLAQDGAASGQTKI